MFVLRLCILERTLWELPESLSFYECGFFVCWSLTGERVFFEFFMKLNGLFGIEVTSCCIIQLHYSLVLKPH